MSNAQGSGRLTDADRARIRVLAERGLKAFSIAKEIKRHQATVHWFMYTEGLTAPKYHPNRKNYVRKGRIVRPFTPEEDAFIEALRVQDFTPEQIAAHTSKRFGTERTHHTIRVRLTMLAAREVAA